MRSLCSMIISWLFNPIKKYNANVPVKHGPLLLIFRWDQIALLDPLLVETFSLILNSLTTRFILHNYIDFHKIRVTRKSIFFFAGISVVRLFFVHLAVLWIARASCMILYIIVQGKVFFVEMLGTQSLIWKELLRNG